MSVFSNVIKDLKSFAAKVESAFKKLFGDAPSWIAIAQGVLTYLGPIVVTILTIGGGAALGKRRTDYWEHQGGPGDGAGYGDDGDAAGSLPKLLADIQLQLPALLAAVKISNPSTVTSIENYTNIIDTEITALLNALPAAA